MSGRCALVTGAGGFVGANLCRRLLRDGHAVHAIVRPGADSWRLAAIRNDISLHHLDVRDTAAVRAVVGTVRPEWFFHLAAHGAYSWQSDPDAIVTTNLDAAFCLVDLAGAGAFEAFVQAGSTAEYGFKDHPAQEVEPVAPRGSYAVSKAAATRYARSVSLARGAHIVTLRLGTAYGPWEDPRRLLPTLATFGLRRRLPPLTDPGTVRDFVFVDDVCAAFTRAASATYLARGSVVNIGSGAATSLAELVDLVRGEFAIDEPPQWLAMAPRRWDKVLSVADCTSARQVLDWRPRLSLASGFHTLVDWLRHDSVMRARYAEAIGLPT